MSTEVTLPALGDSVTHGTITRWLKSVGDSVTVGEPLLEVSTDKVDTEIPSPVAGTLLEIKATEDETVEVGAELAVVGAVADAAGHSDSPRAPRHERATLPDPAAVEHTVGLSTREGTSAGGRVHKEEVAGAIGVDDSPMSAPALASAEVGSSTPAGGKKPSSALAEPFVPSPLRGQTQKMTRLRKIVATRMVESLQTAAQLTTVVEVDVTSISRLRNAVKSDFFAREGVKLSYLPFLAKAATDALKCHPSVNASVDMDNGEVTYHEREDLAIAVDTERGLLTPVIRDAGSLSITGIARKIADIAERTRANKIGADELSGGTFTLTNTGSRGALFDTPIINQPQVAILGTGAVVKRPVVIDDINLGETIAVRHMVYLALTYDHRIVDGADAARYLTDVRQRLESGTFEV